MQGWSAWVVGVALAVTAVGARAQGGCTFVDDSGKSVFWPNCKDPSKADPAAAKPAAPAAQNATPAADGPPKGDTGSPNKFPFPGETPAASAPATQQAPAKPGEAAAPGAGKRFPFPGEDAPGAAPATAAKPATSPDGLKDAGSSGSSSDADSSSSSSSSSSDHGDSGAMDGDDDAAAKAAAARHRKRIQPTVKEQSTVDREVEDLSVAGFYQTGGNYRGAYMRAKDAVSIADDDADAHLALADAARKLGKLDEAEANYKRALTLDPVPKTKKAAEKALKEMSGGG